MRFEAAWSGFLEDLALTMIDMLKGEASPRIAEGGVGDEEEDRAREYEEGVMATIVGWIRSLLRQPEFTSPPQRLERLPEQNNGIDVDEILEACLRKPNRFTKIIAHHITTLPTTADESDKTSLYEKLAPFFRYMDALSEISGIEGGFLYGEKRKREGEAGEEEQGLKKLRVVQERRDTGMDMEVMHVDGVDMKNLDDVYRRAETFSAHVAAIASAATSSITSNTSSSLAPTSSTTTTNTATESTTAATPAVSAWTLYNPVEWRPAPLGCLPGGKVSVLDIPVEADGVQYGVFWSLHMGGARVHDHDGKGGCEGHMQYEKGEETDVWQGRGVDEDGAGYLIESECSMHGMDADGEIEGERENEEQGGVVDKLIRMEEQTVWDWDWAKKVATGVSIL
ncbi:hypothetical protein HK102_001876 [Quaeritorhiza haematococci]|nr:hypothetical protein HK102_001876 [Quaeritorhiza haematococci]